MSSINLDNLVKTAQLKVEPMNQQEFAGLLHSAAARLHDATNPSLAAESRFDLAYNAAHSLRLTRCRPDFISSHTFFKINNEFPHFARNCKGCAFHQRNAYPLHQ